MGLFIFWENIYIYRIKIYMNCSLFGGGGDLFFYFFFVLGMIFELNLMYFYLGYIRKSDLVVYMRFYFKERVYKCNYCEK